jgi:hypothetical protein
MFLLLIFQQVIWLGPIENVQSLKTKSIQITIFYDNKDQPRLIIIPGPGPVKPPDPGPVKPPDPGPVKPPDPGPVKPDHKYNVFDISYTESLKMPTNDIIALSQVYREVATTIANDKRITRQQAQAALIDRSNDILGSTLTGWKPIFDKFAKVANSSNLPTTKEMAQFYLEIADGMDKALKDRTKGIR